MRPQVLLAGALALAGRCVAEIEAVEAAKILYYWTQYDFDSRMWGTGYIAPKCKGSRDDGKCTFDEFVNYFATGEASPSPSYYTIESGFSFFPGDVMAIVTALMKLNEIKNGHIPRIVQGRTTAQGLFDDLARILDKNHERANLKQVGMSRHAHNLMESLGGLRAHLEAKNAGNLATKLQAWNRDVNWKIVQRESAYVKNSWNMIDWEATVKVHPELRDVKSTLYGNTVKAIKGETNLAGNLADKKIAQNVAGVFQKCLKG